MNNQALVHQSLVRLELQQQHQVIILMELIRRILMPHHQEQNGLVVGI